MRQGIGGQTARHVGQEDRHRTLALGVCRRAVLFLRHTQPGKEYFTKLEHQHGKATALTGLAHKLARAVYYLLARAQAFDLTRFVTA